MRSKFFGGVHPDPRKELSAGRVPTPLPAPAQVVIPMAQHIGAVCTPLVQPGDTVAMGQKIGDGPGLCVPVHASVSGRVAAVEPRPHVTGREVLSVVIENDFQDTPSRELSPHPNPDALTAEEIVTIIREAGIVGMGGATFPTDVKANTGIGKVDTLIANACECEPYITADDALLCTHAANVLRGLSLMRRVLEPERTVLGIEDNKPEAIAKLRQLQEEFPDIEVAVLPTRYPQGAEKQLIQALTGRQVPGGALPASVGCAVFNVATCASVYEAVYKGRPITRRIVTVTGEGIRTPMNLIVRIGTPFSQVVEAAGGLTEDIWKVISGGPMMGVAQRDLRASVIKGTTGILCLTARQNGEVAHPTCIRCAKCVAACPMKLQPLYLYRFEAAGDLDQLRRLNAMDCIECGCCAHLCPGKLPLVEKIRAAKKRLKEASAQ